MVANSPEIQIVSWSFLFLFTVALVLRLVQAHKKYNYTVPQLLYVSTDFNIIILVGLIWIATFTNRLYLLWIALASSIVACLIIIYIGFIKKQAVKVNHFGGRTLGHLARGIRGDVAKKDAFIRLCVNLSWGAVILYILLTLRK